MTRSLIEMVVVIGAGAAAYISLSTDLKLNQAASSQLIMSIDRNRQLQAELYKQAEDEAIKRILSLLDRTQENIKMGIDQNIGLTQNVLGLAKSVDDVSKQNQQLAQQNNELSQEMAQVLGEHTRTLEQAKNKASEAAQVAKSDQLQTRRALKEIGKPKKSWWGNLFASPTPSKGR